MCIRDSYARGEEIVETINQNTDCKAYMHDLADLAILKAKMREADIFCDATGVGMHPLEDLSNIPDSSYFRKDLIVTDTVYAPVSYTHLDVYKRQDEILLDALLMRNRIVEDIMVYKEQNDVPILQPEQEAKQREWLENRMEGKRHKDEVAAVFEEITRNSKKIQARKLFDYNIVLIGFMGAGKSTISDFLRTVFAMEVIEMDQIIAEREEMSISDIFETYGEEYCRDLETKLLLEMQSRKNVVISCGGGVPMRERLSLIHI